MLVTNNDELSEIGVRCFDETLHGDSKKTALKVLGSFYKGRGGEPSEYLLELDIRRLAAVCHMCAEEGQALLCLCWL